MSSYRFTVKDIKQKDNHIKGECDVHLYEADAQSFIETVGTYSFKYEPYSFEVKSVKGRKGYVGEGYYHTMFEYLRIYCYALTDQDFYWASNLQNAVAADCI